MRDTRVSNSGSSGSRNIASTRSSGVPLAARQIRTARRDDGFPFASVDRTGVAVRGLDRLNAPLADLTDAQGETLFLQRAVAVVEVDRVLPLPPPGLLETL